MEDDDDGGGSGGGEARRVEQKEDDDRDDSNSDDDDSDRGSKEDGGSDGEGGVGDDDNAEGEGEEEGGEGSVEIIEIEEEEGRDAEGEAERVDEEEQEQAEEERGGEKREDGVDGKEEREEGGGRAEEQNREAHAAEEGGEGGGSGGGDHMNATINLDLDNDEYWRPQERNILRGMRQRCRRQAARHRLCQLSWGPKKRARSDLHEYDSVPRVLQPAGQPTRNPRGTASPPPHQQRAASAASPALQQGSLGSPRQQATGSPGQQAAGSPGQQPRRSARLQAAGPPPVPPLADLLKFAQKLPRPPPRVSQGRLGCLDHVITFSRRSWRLPAPERALPSSPRQPLQALRRKEDYLGMKVVEASDLDTAYNRLILPERAQRFLDTRGFVPPQVVLVLDEEMAGPSGWFMKYSKWDGGHYVLHGMELLPFLQHLAVVPGQDCLSFFYVPRMHTLRLLKSPIHTLH